MSAERQPEKRKSRGPISIRTRIFGGFLGLLVVVFVVISVSYNLVVNAYITREVHRQLGMAAEYVNSDVLAPRDGRWPEQIRQGRKKQQWVPELMPKINDAARRATFLTQVQTLAIDQHNQLVSDEIDGEIPEQTRLTYEAIARSGVDLDGAGIQRVDADKRTYFVFITPLSVSGAAVDSKTTDAIEAGDQDDVRLLMYLDMTDAQQLARTLNYVLLWIILATSVIAASVALVMSTRITKPIRMISDFAAAIGRSDFTRREAKLGDRELVELLDTMNHTAEQLDKYDKEQKTFFQNASHELRTPLMSIKGYAEGIQVGVFDDDKQAAGVIISESDHLTSMVEDLLYLSKLDNITAPDALSPIDLRELLNNCAEGLRGVALHEGVQIAYDFEEDPVMVSVSEKALTRALVNVLSNGMRYAQSRVTVSCKTEDGRAVARVEDDGAGIDADDLPQLFNRFYKGRGGKHGIGLSIAKAVVQQHGGSIRAENTGHGASFIVELPLEDGER